jgi:hypothetical protein
LRGEAPRPFENRRVALPWGICSRLCNFEIAAVRVSRCNSCALREIDFSTVRRQLTAPAK